MLQRDKKPKGFWCNVHNALVEARKVIQEHGFETLPSADELNGLGYCSLSVSISKYHGGFFKFRQMLGEQQKVSRYYGTWKNLEYAIGQARKVMMDHGFETLPRSDKLNELGYFGLSYAITKYHGGFHKFRKLLGDKSKQRESGLWQSLDYTTEQVRKVMQEHGLETLPSPNKLKELGCSSLIHAILIHGGFSKFRKLIGEAVLRKDGVWQSLDYTIEQAMKVIESNGFEVLPSSGKLRELGYSSLAMSIVKYHGGFPYFRQILNPRLGIPSEKQQLEGILDRYLEDGN